jgi:hypothetical protein
VDEIFGTHRLTPAEIRRSHGPVPGRPVAAEAFGAEGRSRSPRPDRRGQ